MKAFFVAVLGPVAMMLFLFSISMSLGGCRAVVLNVKTTSGGSVIARSFDLRRGPFVVRGGGAANVMEDESDDDDEEEEARDGVSDTEDDEEEDDDVADGQVDEYSEDESEAEEEAASKLRKKSKSKISKSMTESDSNLILSSSSSLIKILTALLAPLKFIFGGIGSFKLAKKGVVLYWKSLVNPALVMEPAQGGGASGGNSQGGKRGGGKGGGKRLKRMKRGASKGLNDLPRLNQ